VRELVKKLEKAENLMSFNSLLNKYVSPSPAYFSVFNDILRGGMPDKEDMRQIADSCPEFFGEFSKMILSVLKFPDQFFRKC
jgi:hypothetical protein